MLSFGPRDSPRPQPALCWEPGSRPNPHPERGLCLDPVSGMVMAHPRTPPASPPTSLTRATSVCCLIWTGHWPCRESSRSSSLSNPLSLIQTLQWSPAAHQIKNPNKNLCDPVLGARPRVSPHRAPPGFSHTRPAAHTHVGRYLANVHMAHRAAAPGSPEPPELLIGT